MKFKEVLRLSNSYIRKDKSKFILLTLCVAIAITLFSSQSIINESVTDIKFENVKRIYGDYQIVLKNLDYDTAKKISLEQGINKAEIRVNQGNVYDKSGIKLEMYSKLNNKIGVENYKFVSGRFPNKPGEIVIDKYALNLMRKGQKCPQEISLYNYKQYKDKNGSIKYNSKKVKYNLVGVIERPEEYYKIGASYKGFTYHNNSEVNKEKVSYEVLFTDINNKRNNIIEKYNLDREVNLDYNGNFNVAYAQWKGAKKNSGDYYVKIPMILVSIFMMLSVFNMVVSDKVKQIGMLRVIGATKKQILTIFAIQTIVIEVIGYILGMILGICYSYINIHFFGLYDEYKDVLSLTLSANSFIYSLAISLFTVIVASAIPLIKAYKIAPITAVRETGGRSSLKCSRGINRNRYNNKKITLFKMAKNNFWNNKSKAILSIITIAIGGSLLIYDASISEDILLNDSLSDGYISLLGKYDINVEFDENQMDYKGISGSDIKYLKSIEELENISVSHSFDGYYISNINDINSVIVDYYDNKNYEKLDVSSYILDRDYADIKDLILEDKSDEIKSYLPKVLVCNRIITRSSESTLSSREIVNPKLKVGDIVTLKYQILKDGKLTFNEVKVIVGGFLSDIWTGEGYGSIGRKMDFVFSPEEWNKAFKIDSIKNIKLRFKEGVPKEKKEKLSKEICTRFDKKYSIWINSRTQRDKENKYMFNIYLKKQIINTVFMLLIIFMQLFINIRMDLVSRLSSIRILRAVGMSRKTFNKMINIENTILYIFSSIGAFVLGSLLKLIYTIRDYYSIKESAIGFDMSKFREFKFPIKYTFIYICILFVMIFVALKISKRKMAES